MKLKALLGCVVFGVILLAIWVQPARAQGTCPAAPTLISLSPNYFPIYYKSPSTFSEIASPAITINATSNCIDVTLVGTPPKSDTTNVEGSVNLNVTPRVTVLDVGDFTQLTPGKFQFWTWASYKGVVFSTNTLDFWIDEPTYMLVVSDNTYNPAPPMHPNVWRQVIYEVHNTSGSLAPQINIGEAFTYSQSSPPCNSAIHLNTTSCSLAAVTNTYGKFTDRWAINSTASPAGCGISNAVDHWEACSPNVHDHSNPPHRLPVKPYGTLTGYIHTNEIDILGHVTPPQTNHMITGSRINP